MGRIIARDCGFKMVFEYLFDKEALNDIVFEDVELNEEEKKFSSDILLSVKNNLSEIENKIAKNLKNDLKIKDLYKLDYAILLVSVACIDYLKEPLSLVINEGVELAKKYSTDKSPSFVNGVLSSIYKN